MQDSIQLCKIRMDAAAIDSWSQIAKKHKSHAQGHLQRENQKLVYAETPYSHLARYLLDEFTFGGLWATQVQQLSMIAKLDGVKHTTVDKLSSLGTIGKHTQHIQRGLLIYMKKYLHPIVQPEADCVKIPLKIQKGPNNGTHLLPHYYLAPHKLMSFMYNHFKTSFKDKILGPDCAM